MTTPKTPAKSGERLEGASVMNQNDTPEFVIAALGASAGGLEPLETFFKYMSADGGIAFVIIQHLAPDHPTALPELLGRHTGMPVEQAPGQYAGRSQPRLCYPA
jgi:two-component system, chemotaxis family, CheB/CheR fusion protein